MDLKFITKQTAKTIVSYLTYQAVRVVVAQLRETNPPLSFWFQQFSSTEKIQDGEAYLRELLGSNQELAFRVMTVRAHLADDVIDFMPELVRTTIQKENIEHRRQYLERITRLEISDMPDDSGTLAGADFAIGGTEISSDSVERGEPESNGDEP